MNITFSLILMITAGIIGAVIAQFIMMTIGYFFKKPTISYCPWCTQAVTKEWEKG